MKLKILVFILALMVMALSRVDVSLLPKQSEALNGVLHAYKYMLFSGGVGSGKTTTGSHFAIERMVNDSKCVGFIGANTYKQLDQSTLKNFFQYLHQYQINYTFNTKPHYGYRSKFKKHDGILSFPNGCQVITRSLDNYDDLRGIELGWVWIDETRDTKVEAWRVLLGRHRDKQAKRLCGLITSTPNGYDWMYDEFVDKPGKVIDNKVINRGYGYVISSTEDNEKNLPDGYIETLISSYDKKLADQEIRGLFTNISAGKAYYAFDKDKHVIDIYDDVILGYKKYFVSFDFNVSPMTASICIMKDGRLIQIDEFYRDNSNSAEAAQYFADKYLTDRYDKESIEVEIHGDATGRARSTASNMSNYQIIIDVLSKKVSTEQIDLMVSRSNPSVRDRMASVNNALEKGNLLLSRKCENTIRDFERVKMNDKGEIDKKDIRLSHSTDNIGYLVVDKFPNYFTMNKVRVYG